MQLIARCRRSIDLRREEGFTLPELLVGMLIGTIVLMAALTMLDTTVSMGTKVGKRVDATQRGRTGLDRITRDLRSQVCLPGDPALDSLIAASDNSVDVYADLGDGSAARPPQRRTITFDPAQRTVVERVYTPTGSSGTYVFPTSPTTTTMLVRDVIQDGTTPIFTYYPIDATPDDDVAPTALSTSSGALSATDLDNVARIRVTFKALPSGRTTAKPGDAVMQDDVYRHAVDPNSTDLTAQCW
jgi:prepilin-type N-terminal cleavage/methylation domain-containing protein